MEKSDSDQVTVIGAGITLAEAQKASKILKEEGINVRLIDPFTVKPLDRVAIVDSARSTGGRIVVVEDHYAEGKRAGVNKMTTLNVRGQGLIR